MQFNFDIDCNQNAETIYIHMYYLTFPKFVALYNSHAGTIISFALYSTSTYINLERKCGKWFLNTVSYITYTFNIVTQKIFVLVFT